MRVDRPSPTLIQAVGLAHSISGRTVLSGIDFAMNAGDCVLILGPNGAGKTTLLKCLGGAVRPQAGGVILGDHHRHSHRSTRRMVGLVAHESRLYEHLTIRENLLFAARMYQVRRPAARVDHVLEDSGLIHAASALPAHLSRGMLRRAAIARSLIHAPQVWLLDEPAAGLDDEGCRWLETRIRRLCREGGCCCVTTHRPDVFETLRARRLQLRRGRLVDELRQATGGGTRVEPVHREVA